MENAILEEVSPEEFEMLPAKTPNSVFVHVYFITIASVLGTGILGLPVKLGEVGFSPFAFSYSICFLVQVASMFLVTELLQRGRFILEAQSMKENTDKGGILLEEFSEFGEREDDDEVSRELPRKSESMNPNSNPRSPDLHTLGTLFLNKAPRILFDVSLMVHLISILITYALAGSQAYGQLLHIDFRWIIAPFVILLSLFLIYGNVLLAPILSSLTFLKGSILFLMVLATAILGQKIDEPMFEDWRYIGQPFLISTVALGGAINLLPVLFSKVVLNRKDIIKFLVSSIAAMFTVFCLNVLWCYFILRIVPQTKGDINLQNSKDNGEISTIPLVKIIEKDYPQFLWVAIFANVFIVISITASYLALGTGTKHVLDGFLATQYEGAEEDDPNVFLQIWRQFEKKVSRMNPTHRKNVVYGLCYGVVLIVALSNPKAFIIIMERVTSLALNLSCGVFIAIMAGIARSEYTQSIPFALSEKAFRIRWIILGYFGFAVFYDILGLLVTAFVGPTYL